MELSSEQRRKEWAQVAVVEEVRSLEDAAKAGTLVMDEKDRVSNHIILLCGEQGSFPQGQAVAKSPAWVAALSKEYPSCRISQTFGPNTEAVHYSLGCGTVLHMKEPIPALAAEANAKAEREMRQQEALQRKSEREALVTACSEKFVASCESKRCIPFATTPSPCPGGLAPRPDDRSVKESPRPACKCVCGNGGPVAVPVQEVCKPRPNAGP